MKPFYTRTRCVVGVLLVFLLPLAALAQPANDQCANAITLNSGTTCVNTTGSLMNGATAATPTAGILAFCGIAASPDVWYLFEAQTTSPTITLSNMGALMAANRRIQIFNTTSCTVATLNGASLSCVNNNSLVTAGLVPGQTYLVRIFSAVAVAGTQAQWQYDICITDPATAPANNACTSITALTSNITCNNTWGTLLNSTATGGINAFCGIATSPDVWYSFVAQTPFPVITLSNMGTSLDNSPRLQLFNTNKFT